MQGSPREPITVWTNVYTCLCIQKTSWSISNTFLIRYRSGGTPNESQHQVTCELQGWRIEVRGLPALVLPVNACRWVLVDNTYLTHWYHCLIPWFKKTWHILRLCDATASRIMVGTLLSPWVNPPLHATGQFSHYQCMQSMLPSIPGKSQDSPNWRSCSTTSWFGGRKYCSSKTSITPGANLPRHSNIVFVVIFIFSSSSSADVS
jgi:hypothetical protein